MSPAPPIPDRSLVPDAIRTISLRKEYPPPASRRRWKRAPTSEGGPGGAGHAGSSAPVVALQGLDLAVGEGEFFGLLGPNGAGKTTTIGILTTRVKATSGAAFVAGVDVLTDDVAVKQRIGVVPQRPNADRRLPVLE